MVERKLDTSSWDRRVMRLSLCVLMLLLAACATQKVADEPAPLEDRTADTDYDLEAVEEKLRQAERIEYTGGRAAAVLVVGTAQRMLPEGHEREHDYLEVIKAGMWARDGEHRDPAKAAALLDEVAARARLRKDGRLLADIDLVNVLLGLVSDDLTGAAKAGDEALTHLQSVDAYFKLVETACDLAYQFMDHDFSIARRFADRARRTALRLDNDVLTISVELVSARIEQQSGGNPDAHFLEAYEAAYRMNDLGWRNVVISQAINAWDQRDDHKRVVEWGNRLREHRMGSLGELPRYEDSALWEGDYITMLAQYAFAAEKLEKGSARAREAAALVVETIDGLPEGEREQWDELAEKLRSGLLQQPAEK